MTQPDTPDPGKKPIRGAYLVGALFFAGLLVPAFFQDLRALAFAGVFLTAAGLVALVKQDDLAEFDRRRWWGRLFRVSDATHAVRAIALGVGTTLIGVVMFGAGIRAWW